MHIYSTNLKLDLYLNLYRWNWFEIRTSILIFSTIITIALLLWDFEIRRIVCCVAIVKNYREIELSWEPRYIVTVTSQEFTEALQLYRNKEMCTVEEDSIIRSHDLSRASSFHPIFLSAARRMQVSAVNNGWLCIYIFALTKRIVWFACWALSSFLFKRAWDI